jgi:hypothetical protein
MRLGREPTSGPLARRASRVFCRALRRGGTRLESASGAERYRSFRTCLRLSAASRAARGPQDVCGMCSLVLDSSNTKVLFAGTSCKPSGTDSKRRPPPYHALQPATGRNLRQRFSLDLAVLGPGRFARGCDRLQPRGSIKAPSFVVCPDDDLYLHLGASSSNSCASAGAGARRRLQDGAIGRSCAGRRVHPSRSNRWIMGALLDGVSQ